MKHFIKHSIYALTWLAVSSGMVSAESAISMPEWKVFGQQIQQAVQEKDLNGLFALVRGELMNGPRKKFVEGKRFDEIFSEEWRESVLANGPVGMGWRGYMLGEGKVWYEQDGQTYRLYAMHGGVEEPIDFEGFSPVWEVDGMMLSPAAFTSEWVSGDNYWEFIRQFEIQDPPRFERNPGLYWGKEIPTLDPIIPSWSDGDEKVSLITNLNDLNVSAAPLQVKKRFVHSIPKGELGEEPSSYRLLARIDKERCKMLAPHLKPHWSEAYLVELHIPSGGSMGTQKEYTVFGLYVQPNALKLLIPLRNFAHLNDALNQLDVWSNEEIITK